MCDLHYVAYIGVDAAWVGRYVGMEQAEWLQRYAADLLTSVAADTDVVARIAEGRFALAFQSPDEERALQRVGELLARLNEYEPLGEGYDRRLFRAGLYCLEGSDASCETALLYAEHGYRVAEQSGEPCCVGNRGINERSAFVSRVERQLKYAVSNGEILLYLQFVVDARDSTIVAAEALSRWQTPTEGLLSPGQYIDAMKTAGIADRLDYHMLEQSCSRLAAWKSAGASEAGPEGSAACPGMGSLSISCNVSRSTMASADFIPRLADIAARYDFEPSHLIIELTEEALSGDVEQARANVLACKEAGYRIALDDMGSGATSLGDLCDYPIDILKIDRELVGRVTTSQGEALIRGVCQFAHALGVQVLCEGVETAQVDALVRAAGCDLIQGYHYAHLYPEADAVEVFFGCSGNLRPA